MKILLFAGTGDGHDLSLWLAEQGFPFTVCVATEYGETLLPKGMDVRAGRMDQAAMAALMGEGYTTVVDATHPYAVEVTKNICAAAERAGLPYLRLLRQSDGEDDCHKADTMEAAAEMLLQLTGNVLLTTGSKELHHFAVPGLRERCFPRVLPMIDSLQRCLSLGFPPKNIICMQGPFTREMNVATLKQYDIRTMVTKDTGSYGGFREKAAAAREAGCTLLVVERPVEEAGLTMDELKAKLKQEAAQ